MTSDVGKIRWHCVIRVHDDRLLYLGQDAAQAALAAQDDGHCATADTRGQAQRLAAIEAAKLRRTRKPPRPNSFGFDWLSG